MAEMTGDMPEDAVDAPWWQRGVVYQVYPRSFQDSNGDGIGDLQGVIDRLDHVAALGVDAIWLSPFYPSPMADFGYDVADYCDVDPVFGTLEIFDGLVRAAHERGLRVIIDFVPNHTSVEHPWFEASRSSRDDPKRDWYVWRDSRPDGAPPNNWLASFGGRAWTFDDTTGQWYLHSFLPEQPDLNWRNHEVREAMFDVVRFWLSRGVDGFRIDVCYAIAKHPELLDNPPTVKGDQHHEAVRDYDSQLHVHDRNDPYVHEIYRELRSLVDGWPDGRRAVLIGEVHVDNLDEWAKFFGAGDEMQLPFNFGLLRVEWDARAIAAHVQAVESVTAGVAGWPTYVLGNHDERRVASRLGVSRARAAMMLLLTLRGTPTMYFGDELGHPDVPIPPDRERDPWGLREPGLGLSRDPSRSPMPWTDEPGAGFAPVGVEPWLPIVDDTAHVSVASQEGRADSMLELTRQLLAVRRDHPALEIGRQRIVLVTDHVFATERSAATDRVLIAINMSGTVQNVSIGEGGAAVLVSTHPGGPPVVALDALVLAPDQGVVLAPPSDGAQRE
jgi:glycosidase